MALAPHFELTIDKQHLRTQVKEFLIKVFPSLTEDDIDIEVFPNSFSRGLINTMVKCSWKKQTVQPDAVIIRIPNQEMFQEFHPHKRAEEQHIQILHKRNCAPRVIATFQNGFCYEYQKGDVLTADRLAEEPICWLIARELAKIHSCDIESLDRTPAFIEEKMQEKFIATFPKEFADSIKNERLKNELPTIEVLTKELEMVKKHVLDLPDQKVVLCHQDVRAENIVYNQNEGTVSFLDFEAVGYNYQSSELANHFSRYCGIRNIDFSRYPTKEFQKKWIRVYLEEYHRQIGKNADVTETDVERLYVLSAKYNLFLQAFIAICGPAMELMGLPVDFLNFGIENYKQYCKDKEKVLAMTLPE